MNFKSLIMLLSLLLVISPVSVAYSALMSDVSDSDTKQTSHCEQSVEKKSDKSCCQDNQCDSQCQSMQCNSFGKLSALSIETGVKSHHAALLYGAAILFYGPDKGLSNTPLRPPINTL